MIKTSSEDEDERRLQDVFKTSSRRLHQDECLLEENKIPDTSGLVKKIDCNTKITETEGKIPDISNLEAKTALTALENNT